MANAMRILGCCLAITSLVLGGCSRKGPDQDPGEALPSTTVPAAKADVGKTPAHPETKPTILDLEVPPPKYLGVRELRHDYDDGQPQIVRQAKVFSDDSTVNHGSYVEYYPGGQKLREGRFDEGKKEGPWSNYFEDGKKAKLGTYKSDKPHGTFVFWRPDGTKEREESYRDSQRDGRWTFYNEQEKPVRQEEYRNGKKHGAWIRWDENGQKLVEERYVDDLLDGPQTAWHPNGQMKAQVQCKGGKAHGTSTTWDEAGKKLSEQRYENGVLVKKETEPKQP